MGGQNSGRSRTLLLLLLPPHVNLLILLLLPPPSILSAESVIVVADARIISSSAVTMPSFGGGGGANNNNNNNNNIPAVFVFGDSQSDTGNGWFVNHRTAFIPPFGKTFPGYPDGRFSDGRIFVSDFLAEHLGLPPVNPWLNVFLNFEHGANYAIPGATALASMPFPLATQVAWHLDLVHEVYNNRTTSSSSTRMMLLELQKQKDESQERRKRLPTVESLGDALYVIEIGGLDYRINESDVAYSSPELVNATIVPLVVDEIRIALETLYNGGDAKKFVVVSVGAQGCHSVTLALFPNMPRDSRGCVKPIDDISWNSGQQTLAMLENLHQLHPDANYNFVDLYSATHYIIDHRDEFGFTNPFDACCGAGNRYPYGFNDTIFECSNVTESLYVCPNPINYISWDGTHYTDSFNFQVFNQTFLTGTFLYSM